MESLAPLLEISQFNPTLMGLFLGFPIWSIHVGVAFVPSCLPYTVAARDQQEVCCLRPRCPLMIAWAI